jgi:hypothetical protein
MNYAKLIDGTLEYAPRYLKLEGRVITNPRAETYQKAGYKPIRDEAYPDGSYAVREFTETETEIVAGWRIEDAPETEAPAAEDSGIEALKKEVVELRNELAALMGGERE